MHLNSCSVHRFRSCLYASARKRGTGTNTCSLSNAGMQLVNGLVGVSVAGSSERALARPSRSSNADNSRSAPAAKASQRDQSISDAGLVGEVRSFMKCNKLSQVMVGQEARVSQAVISQWLSLKYHGHNAKVS